MADYEKVNDVAAGSIEKINDIAKSSIEKINDMTTPSSGATYWITAMNARDIAFAASSDTTSWTNYDAGINPPAASVNPLSLGYGQDNSSNPLYVITNATDNGEMMRAPNAADSSTTWTAIQNDYRLFDVAYGNSVWVAVGQMTGSSPKGNNVFRSTDGGTNWSSVDVSGAQDIENTGCYAIVYSGLNTSDGGIFYFAQRQRIFKSSDGGATWALAHTLVDSGGGDPGDIRALQVTNSSLVAFIKSAGELFSCSLSDDTDWSTETSLTQASGISLNTNMASGGGRVVLVQSQKFWAADVSGKSITLEHDNADLSSDTHGNATSVGTDGSGTFIVGCTDGDILKSTDNADSFSKQGGDPGAGASLKCVAMIGNVLLPV